MTWGGHDSDDPSFDLQAEMEAYMRSNGWPDDDDDTNNEDTSAIFS